MSPAVSIILPNLNKGPFIAERIASLQALHFRNWECIVIDSHSDDGSREALEDFARRDARVHFHLAPRDGIYPSWNRGLQRARGRYVYFATSDDTCRPDLLDRTVSALDNRPEAGLCAFAIEIIGEDGRILHHRWENDPRVRYYGDWMRRAHLRQPDAEWLRFFLLGTLHVSMTGLLIRRQLFEHTGHFATDCGYMADLLWQMRAARCAPTLYLPDKLATFRQYGAQASEAGNQRHHELFLTCLEREWPHATGASQARAAAWTRLARQTWNFHQQRAAGKFACLIRHPRFALHAALLGARVYGGASALYAWYVRCLLPHRSTLQPVAEEP